MRQAACFITSTTSPPNAPTASRRRNTPGSSCLILTPAPKQRYLNEVFLLVLDNIPTWRSMSATYAVDNLCCRRSQGEEQLCGV